MPWPADHPAVTDPLLIPWAGGLDEVLPGARIQTVLRYLPGRRVATLVEYDGEPAVVKVFASPRARGNTRRLCALATSSAAHLVPTALGVDAAGHVLVVNYRPGKLPKVLSDAEYPACLYRVGVALRQLHDSGAELDRVWDWEKEVAQLRRRATPTTTGIIDLVAASTGRLSGAPLATAHRDCHPRQVIIEADGRVAFIDLDDSAMAPRGLDVGNMLGHLVRDRITGRRSARVTQEASEAFLRGYGPCAELGDAVVTDWTMLSVVRLAGLAESHHNDVIQRDALHAHCHADLAGMAGVA